MTTFETKSRILDIIIVQQVPIKEKKISGQKSLN